jgi:hypothetical protein
MNTSGRTGKATALIHTPAPTRSHRGRRQGRRGWAIRGTQFAPAAATVGASDSESCYVLGYN